MRATPNYLQRHGRQLTLSSPPQIVRDLRRDRAERFVYRVLCARQASLVAQVDDMKYRWLCIIMAIFYTWTGISKLICNCQLSTLQSVTYFICFGFSRSRQRLCGDIDGGGLRGEPIDQSRPQFWCLDKT